MNNSLKADFTIEWIDTDRNWRIIMLKKIVNFLKKFFEPCNPPYDCPFCMHCYKNGGEIED